MKNKKFTVNKIFFVNRLRFLFNFMPGMAPGNLRTLFFLYLNSYKIFNFIKIKNFCVNILKEISQPNFYCYSPRSAQTVKKVSKENCKFLCKIFFRVFTVNDYIFVKTTRRAISTKKLFLEIIFLFLPFSVKAYFFDIEVTHPNFYAIDFLEKNNVVEGYPYEKEKIFKPLQPVNRAEAMKMLILSANLELIKEKNSNYPDVSEAEWFWVYINTATKKNIVQGFGDGLFYPASHVTRAEFMKMSLLSFDALIYTKDIEAKKNAEDWYAPFFDFAKKYNIISDKDFTKPHEPLTRGSVAEIIYRTAKVAKNKFTKKYIFSGAGKASYYGQGFAGRPTASGEIYNPNELTAAHRTLPFGTKIKVFYENKMVIVKINDRGPYYGRRILDLSEKAFSNLAPTNRGVINVNFEIFSENEENQISIPEYIRPILTTESKNEIIPEVISNKISDYREGKEETKYFLPLFTSSIQNYSEDFFSNVILRKPFPQKIIEGSVINISGTATEEGHQKVTMFMQKKGEKNKQKHFSTNVSGKNFVLPVYFLESGIFEIGIIFDKSRKSRLAEIEVVPMGKNRWFPSTKISFESELNFRLIPEEKKIVLNFDNQEDYVTKIIFSQTKVKKKVLYIEDGISEIFLDYDFFKNFETQKNLAIDLFQALSENGTLQKQYSNWKKVVFDNFLLTPGFPDEEKKEISITHLLQNENLLDQDSFWEKTKNNDVKFERFFHKLAHIHLAGKILSPNINFPANAYLIDPEGFVKDVFLKKNQDTFFLTFNPTIWGTYILEIISDSGEILFNRAFYFSEEKILPVTSWPYTKIKIKSVENILFWINTLRKKHNAESLSSKASLKKFAQEYAEKMAQNNFISHEDNEGKNFQERIKKAGFRGSYGENLSYGSTIYLALESLETSASHRKNLLSKKWKHVGIGLAKNHKGEFYVVQVFGE